MILALALLAQIVTHPTPLPDTDGGGTLIDAEDRSAVLQIGSCDLTRWTGATKVKGSAMITLGKGC